MVKPEIRLFAFAALFAIICAVAGVAAAGAPAPIVVLPLNPTVVERSAAKELSGELGKCLGETPKIVLETELPGVGSAPRLFVGATKAAKKAREEAAKDGEPFASRGERRRVLATSKTVSRAFASEAGTKDKEEWR